MSGNKGTVAQISFYDRQSKTHDEATTRVAPE